MATNDKKKILIVEDDLQLLKMLTEELTKHNYEILQATSGKQALSHVKSHKPALVLLDIMLPGGMNGFDFLEQIRVDKELKKVPVIVLTNLDTEEKTARAVGVSDYIVKADTSIGEVVSKVKAHLS